MCADFLHKRKLPHRLRRNSSSVFDLAHDSIKVMTLHVSKGLAFSVVALVGAGRTPATLPLRRDHPGRVECLQPSRFFDHPSNINPVIFESQLGQRPS